MSNCQYLWAVNTVKPSILTNCQICQAVNYAKLSILSSCQLCQTINSVKLSNLLTCPFCQTVNSSKMTIRSNCQWGLIFNSGNLLILSICVLSILQTWQLCQTWQFHHKPTTAPLTRLFTPETVPLNWHCQRTSFSSAAALLPVVPVCASAVLSTGFRAASRRRDHHQRAIPRDSCD